MAKTLFQKLNTLVRANLNAMVSGLAAKPQREQPPAPTPEADEPPLSEAIRQARDQVRLNNETAPPDQDDVDNDLEVRRSRLAKPE